MCRAHVMSSDAEQPAAHLGQHHVALLGGARERVRILLRAADEVGWLGGLLGRSVGRPGTAKAGGVALQGWVEGGSRKEGRAP